METLSGRWMGRSIVLRLMNEASLVSYQQATHRYKRGDREHVAILNAHDRQFAVAEENKVWCADVTYIWSDKCWAYLAVFLDLFS